MPIQYHIDYDSCFILEYWDGKISTSDINQLIVEELPSHSFNKPITCLFELSDDTMEIDISFRELPSSVSLLKSSVSQLINARWAFITDSPKSTALLLYFQRLAYILPVTIDIFSTREAGLAWLNVSEEQYLRSKSELLSTGRLDLSEKSA